MELTQADATEASHEYDRTLRNRFSKHIKIIFIVKIEQRRCYLGKFLDSSSRHIITMRVVNLIVQKHMKSVE